MRGVAFGWLLASVHAGSVEFSTSDLGQKPALDNIKAGWGTSFTVGGYPLKLAAAYDMKAKSTFLKEATLSGQAARVSYAVTQNFANGASKVALSAKHAGVTFKSVLSAKVDVASAWLEGAKVDSLSVSKGAQLSGVDLSFEPSLVPTKMLGRLKTTATYALGGGTSLSSELVATTEGAVEALDVAVATKLDGRPVSAKLQPLSMTAQLQVADKEIGVATATYTVGGVPKVSVKRAFSF